MEEVKNPVGRPAIWTDPKVLEKFISQYFENQKRPTLAGLAVALDIDRQTLYNYAKKDEFFDIIKKARDKVEAIYEEKLVYETNQTGVIFSLKNMGWKDRSDITTNDKDIPSPIYGGKSEAV
jgi:hypothetical protein